MIALPIFCALLTLIDASRTFEYFIDLKRCKESGIKNTDSYACYVRQSCLKDLAPEHINRKMLVAITNDNLKDGTCDVIVQMKAFTKQRYHIMIQVNSTASDPSYELDPTIGVSIVQKETQIQCNSSGVGGGKMTAELFGSRQVNTKSLIFCSAILSHPDKHISSLFDTGYNKAYPSVEFTTTLEDPIVKVACHLSQGQFWAITNVHCSDVMINTGPDTQNVEYLLSEIDKAPLALTCPAPLIVRVEVSSKEKLIETLFCEGSEWSYLEGKEPISIPMELPFEAHCAIAFNQLCQPLKYKKCDGCTQPTLENTTNTCPSNKWRMDNGSVVTTKVICKKRREEKVAGWFMDDGNEITEGSCSSSFVCPIFSKLNFSTQCPEDECKSASSENNEISCPIGYNITNNGSSVPVDKFKCDVETGLYKSGDISLPRGAVVYCKLPPKIVEPQPQTASPAGVIGGCVGGFLFVALIGGVVFFFVWKRNQRKQQFKQLYPDGMMTALEIDDTIEEVKIKKGKYVIVELPIDEVERRKRRKNEKKPKVERPKATPYNEVAVVDNTNCEVLPRLNEFKHWRTHAFVTEIKKDFVRYSSVNRMKCLHALAGFQHYSDREQEDDVIEFGMVEQYLNLVIMCHQYKLKCYDTWDFLFRIMKFFATNLDQKNMHHAPRRLRELFTKIAKEMIADVGYQNMPNETEQMAGIRLVAVRMLLWLNDKRCTEKIMEMAKLPFGDMEKPLRQILMAYAITHYGKEKEIRDMFDKEFALEPLLGRSHGTYRQHLIYALCSAKDTKPSNALMGSTMREILGILHDNGEQENLIRFNYTPTDLLYAYKGALEDPEMASDAIDQFVALAGSCWTPGAEKRFEEYVRKVAGTEDEHEELREKMRKRFYMDMLETCSRVAAACTCDEQFSGVQKAWSKMIAFIQPLKEDFDPHLLDERVHNLNILVDDKRKGMDTAGTIHTFFKNEDYRLAEPEPQKEPGKTEPGKTEPAKTEQVKTELAKTEPAKSEPAKPEPAKTEQVKTEAAKPEPAKTEQVKPEPAKTEPAKTEPGKKEPAKTEQAKSTKSNPPSK